jgi:YaiO family outer membrane protein
LVLVGAVPLTAHAQLPEAPRTELAAQYTLYYFDAILDPWHLASVSLSHRLPVGSIIGSINYAHRFGESGYQFEVDAYPKFGRHLYAYVNAGYSPQGSFPDWRGGGELYANLPAAWEASVGFRHLRFGDAVTIWTGSAGKYYGNYWTSLRPFVRFDEGDVSWTLLIMTRRYFADANTYVGFLAGYGSTPSDVLTEAELERANDIKLELTGKHPLTVGLRWQWRASVEREELTFSRIRYRLGATLRFEREF